MKPTSYWRSRIAGTFARSYWPNATKTEVYLDGEWVERPILLDLTEDVDWELVDEADVTVPT